MAATEALEWFGPLTSLVRSHGTTDVFVIPAGSGFTVWIDRGAGLIPVPVPLGGQESVRRLAVSLLAAGGRALDDANPVGDARLPGGYRVHAALPPIARDGVLLSIRIPQSTPLPLDAWDFPADAVEILRATVHRRENLLIAGATGSGKTTLVASLLREAPPNERLLLIEDVSELVIDHPHVVRLETRRENAEGRGAWNLADLLREALRMRPDRIVVGECRGAELPVLLTALNTGHGGSATTLHAGSLEGIPARLEALAALAGLTPSALAHQTISAIHLVAFLQRDSSGARVLAGFGRFCAGDDGLLKIERIWTLPRRRESVPGG